MPVVPYPHRLHTSTPLLHGVLAIGLLGVHFAQANARNIMTAVTTWRDGGLVSWGGILAGIGLILYLPQFFWPPPVRIAHGLLLAAGCLWLAIGLCSSRQRVAADGGQRTTVGAVITD